MKAFKLYKNSNNKDAINNANIVFESCLLEKDTTWIIVE